MLSINITLIRKDVGGGGVLEERARKKDTRYAYMLLCICVRAHVSMCVEVNLFLYVLRVCLPCMFICNCFCVSVYFQLFLCACLCVYVCTFTTSRSVCSVYPLVMTCFFVYRSVYLSLYIITYICFCVYFWLFLSMAVFLCFILCIRSRQNNSNNTTTYVHLHPRLAEESKGRKQQQFPRSRLLISVAGTTFHTTKRH